jgi:hypothetical protein
VFGDLGVDQLGPKRPQGGEGAGFIPAHEAAVTDHVGSQNGREAALNRFFGHEALTLSQGVVESDCIDGLSRSLLGEAPDMVTGAEPLALSQSRAGA